MLKPTGGWGYRSDTEILFPMRVAPHLRNLRGPIWKELVERALQAPEASPEQLAFSLLLIRINGCMTCHTDCYRAVRGCTVCAIQTVRRFRGPDAELINMFNRAKEDVLAYLESEVSDPKPELIGE